MKVSNMVVCDFLILLVKKIDLTHSLPKPLYL